MGAKKKKKKQKRKKEKPNSGGTKSDSASDSQEIKIQQPSKVRPQFYFSLCGSSCMCEPEVYLGFCRDLVLGGAGPWRALQPSCC